MDSFPLYTYQKRKKRFFLCKPCCILDQLDCCSILLYFLSSSFICSNSLSSGREFSFFFFFSREVVRSDKSFFFFFWSRRSDKSLKQETCILSLKIGQPVYYIIPIASLPPVCLLFSSPAFGLCLKTHFWCVCIQSASLK